MSQIDDYIWFEIRKEEIQKQNIENKSYVIISDHQVWGFENDYFLALKKYGTAVSILHIGV